MTRLLTNDELLAVDQLFWDTEAYAALYQHYTCLGNKIARNNAWMERTVDRRVKAQEHLASIDPKDGRAHKDALTEVDNCDKLLARLTAENAELQIKYEQAKSQHAVIYARAGSYPDIVVQRYRERYRTPRPCC